MDPNDPPNNDAVQTWQVVSTDSAAHGGHEAKPWQPKEVLLTTVPDQMRTIVMQDQIMLPNVSQPISKTSDPNIANLRSDDTRETIR